MDLQNSTGLLKWSLRSLRTVVSQRIRIYSTRLLVRLTLVAVGIPVTAVLAAETEIVPYKTIYPSFYYNRGLLATDSLMLADEIPGKLLDSLPPDYVLAKYTGTLWCYRDMNGGLVRDKSNPGKQFLKPGKSFKSELAQSKRSRTLQIFIPQGYPHVFCKIPREDQIEIYNRTWFLLWLPYLSEWQQREKELEGLLSYGSSIQELANDMKLRIKDIDTQEQLANQATRDLADKNYYLYGILSQECLNESRGLFNRSNTGACEKKALIQQAEDAARNSANQGSGIPAASQPASQPSPLEPISNQPRTKPPFALEGKYDRSKDPFLNVLNTNTLDVSSKTWATDEMSAGKYLDAELASQIDKVNAQLVCSPGSKC